MDDKLYYIWTKGELLKLSDNFTTKELECKCKLDTCKEQRISKDLVNSLQALRKSFGKSIIITSGYRCLEHNRSIGSSDTSQHPLGNAVDVTSSDNDLLYKLSENIFESIGDARSSIGNRSNFIHLDIRRGRKRRWVY
jgi:uncharacterized protein YcbK (DUF882 family)